MTKFALPALILCIVALFFYSVTSQSDDAPPDLAELRAEPAQKPAETAAQDREQPQVKAIEGVRSELQRLSDEARTNSDKIAQTATLRSDLMKLIQDSKSSSDKVAQNLLDQINAMRSDQVKLLKDTKDTGDKAAQALRDDVAASQARLVAQIDGVLKASTARSEALAQRVDVMKKDIEDVKKSFDDDRQNQSNLSPGIALLAALAALVLGPFLAYQVAANQLAGIKQQAAATAAPTQTAKSAEAEPPLAPRAAAEPEPRLETSLHHEAPPLSEEASSCQDADGHPQAATDPEKV